jgi:hypothetical protein
LKNDECYFGFGLGLTGRALRVHSTPSRAKLL